MNENRLSRVVFNNQSCWIVRGLIGTRTFYYLPMLEGKSSDNRPAQESKVT